MDNRELEKKISSSYRNIAPDIRDSVLADCDAQKGWVITMQKNKKKSSVIKYIGGLAAALLLVVGGISFYNSNHAIASTVMLDVNPGIGISVNKNEKVLNVKPYNEDAKVVIGNMDFSGSKLDVAVNALIGSMLRNGYINEDANSILISVDSKNLTKGQAIQTRLMNEISGIIESENLSGAVLGQTMKDDKELQRLSEQYGITIGKANLIDQITKQNKLYSFEDLVSLTINDLNLISESGTTKLENIKSIGTASSTAYIGEQGAKDAALQRAQVSAENASWMKCELDWENGIMVYEVDFDADGYEHEVEINAITGEVIKYDREIDDDYYHVPAVQEKPTATQEKPVVAQESTPTAPEKPVVAQESTPTAPEKPAAAQESTSVVQEKPPVQPTASNTLQSEAAAKQAAYNHAGVDANTVIYSVCELEHNHGFRIYEIEFAAGGYEYEYDVNAETCEVIRYSKETDDDYRAPETGSGNSSSGDVGAAAAKAAALSHAGVSDVRDFECELDYEWGKAVYEISFEAGGYEYEYEVDAATGLVLRSEKERD